MIGLKSSKLITAQTNQCGRMVEKTETQGVEKGFLGVLWANPLEGLIYSADGERTVWAFVLVCE